MRVSLTASTRRRPVRDDGDGAEGGNFEGGLRRGEGGNRKPGPFSVHSCEFSVLGISASIQHPAQCLAPARRPWWEGRFATSPDASGKLFAGALRLSSTSD